MSDTVETKMGLEELRKTVEWQSCTAKQQRWLEIFIVSGDPVFATASVYHCSSSRNAQILSYEIPQKERVREVLNLYHGRSDQDSFLRRLQRQIENGSLTVAQIEAAKLLYSLRGWTCPALPNTHGNSTAAQRDSKQHFVDEIVKQNGNRFKVTAVDANGKITAVEPL